MQEEWKVINEYPGYSVSNLGKVRNDKTGRILKLQPHGDFKYLYVYLSQGKRIGRRVHRLVAQAFIPNPDSKPEVNHIDGCGFNNCSSNLEWTTRSENMIHAYTVLHPDIGKKDVVLLMVVQRK